MTALTYELLMETFERIRNAPYEPHRHIVSPDGFRRAQSGGYCFCVECGALVGTPPESWTSS